MFKQKFKIPWKEKNPLLYNFSLKFVDSNNNNIGKEVEEKNSLKANRATSFLGSTLIKTTNVNTSNDDELRLISYNDDELDLIYTKDFCNIDEDDERDESDRESDDYDYQMSEVKKISEQDEEKSSILLRLSSDEESSLSTQAESMGHVRNRKHQSIPIEFRDNVERLNSLIETAVINYSLTFEEDQSSFKLNPNVDDAYFLLTAPSYQTDNNDSLGNQF